MPIKRALIFFIVLCSCIYAYAQVPPTIEWENSYGGEGDDQSYVIEPTSDGGYISAGWTGSTGGDVPQNPGDNSLFVVKTDGSGELEWANAYGGSNIEVAQDVIETSDGGYLVVGLTSSNDGDVSELEGGAWVIKLDINGNIVWEETYSGNEATSVLETATGYVVSINEYSYTNLTQNEFRLIKIDFTGDIIWEYTHEESSISKGIMQNSDGDYIVAGYTYSEDTYYNLLLVKVDATGNLVWEQSYGGANTDVAGGVSTMIYSVSTSDIITETADGGYMVVGTTNSEDGDVSQHIGMYDVWLVKTDADGNLEWEKSYGGTLPDHGVTIKKTLDEKYMITSTTYSGNGDISQNYDGWDFWIYKINLTGDIEWGKIYGSDHNDHATSFYQINECEFIASGYSWGSDIDIAQNHGDSDFWIAKLIIDLNPPIAETPQTFCELDQPTISDIEIDTDVSEGVPFTFNWYFDEYGTEEIPNDIAIEDGETYYVSQTVSGCESAIQAIETFIIDDELPVANSPQEFCEDDTPAIENIHITGENLTWYADEAGNNPLPENTILESNHTYYVSQTIGNCESSLLPIEILLYPSPDIVTFEPSPISACDNDNDTLADTPFDLTIPGSEITQQNDVLITYFKTESSAQQGDTSTDEFIQNPTEYTNEPLYHEENGAYGISQTIYARVKSTDTENFCALVVPIQLMIIPPPILNVDVDTFGYTLCRETDSNSGVDVNDIITNLYSYIPTGKENDIISLLDQNANLTSNPDNYSITYHTSEADAENNISPVTTETQVDDGTTLYIRVENTDTGCYNAGNIGKIILREVNPPQFKVRHLSQHFDDPHALLVYDVEGSGNYEFSVNNGPWREIGTLQTLTFTGIEPGKHTVYGRDLSNCKRSEKTIHFIGYPKFFTPNNDGYNDTWGIEGTTRMQVEVKKVYIFDRYGKLLKTLSSYNRWDGTVNGKPMPSNDYWFKAEYTETMPNGTKKPRVFRANFTLKR